MDSEQTPRTISPDLIDQAEGVRSTGDFAEALRLTKSALHIEENPLTSQEIKELSLDRTQATLLATGARLIGESSKSIMKRSLLPWQMRDRAVDWLRDAGTLYGNQDLRNAAAKIEWDHHGRPYAYDQEFARDIADFLGTLSLVMNADKAFRLQTSADKIWYLLIKSLDDDDQNKPFFTLEWNWFFFKTGRTAEIDAAVISEAFKEYYLAFGTVNADRIKALAVRTILMALAIKQPEVAELPLTILNNFDDTLSIHLEEKKLIKERTRNIMFKIWGAFTGKSYASLQTYLSAWELGDYQQKRLIHDRK